MTTLTISRVGLKQQYFNYATVLEKKKDCSNLIKKQNFGKISLEFNTQNYKTVLSFKKAYQSPYKVLTFYKTTINYQSDLQEG